MCKIIKMCIFRAWLTFKGIEIEIWSWIIALYTIFSVEEWSLFITRSISFINFFQSWLLYLEWMLRVPVRSSDIRYKTILAWMGCLVISMTRNTITSFKIKYSSSWIISRRTCNTFLLRFTIEWCCLWAEILRCCWSVWSNVGFFLSNRRICGDTFL